MAPPKGRKEKFDRIINAWETLAPAKSFAGMTLAQFKTALQPSYDTRSQLMALKEQVNAKEAERDTADEESLRLVQMVVSGVLADPTEGPDSGLYESFGYKRESERKSGLTRRKKTTPKTET